jgi:SAM-dependent methyltransferase
MMDIQFPAESFDIIWSEGSIGIIGFKKGLLEWKRYLKPQGYLALHDIAWIKDNPPGEIKDFFNKVYPDILTIQQSIGLIEECGYTVIGHFVFPQDAGWEFYYEPLLRRLEMFKKMFADNQKFLDVISDEGLEIEMFRKYHDWYGSVFYVLQKEDVLSILCYTDEMSSYVFLYEVTRKWSLLPSFAK